MWVYLLLVNLWPLIKSKVKFSVNKIKQEVNNSRELQFFPFKILFHSQENSLSLFPQILHWPLWQHSNIEWRLFFTQIQLPEHLVVDLDLKCDVPPQILGLNPAEAATIIGFLSEFLIPAAKETRRETPKSAWWVFEHKRHQKSHFRYFPREKETWFAQFVMYFLPKNLCFA